MWPFSSDSSNSGDGQTIDEAKANLNAQLVKYAAQLKRRLANNEISQAYYDTELNRIRSTQLDDPSDAGWQAFLDAIEQETADLPQTVQTAVTSTAKYVGETVGGTAGNLVGGTFSSLFKGLGTSGWAVALVIIAIAIWAFWKGPLRDAKVKTIPVPV